MHVIQHLGTQCGYEALGAAASTGITASLITPTTGNFAGHMAKVAIVMAETQPIRYRLDAGTPSAANGMLLPVNTQLIIYGTDNIKGFRCFETAGTASVKVLLFF